MSAESWLMDAPGPKARRRTRIGTGIGVVLLLGFVWYAYQALEARGQLNPKIWSVWLMPEVQRIVLEGLKATLSAAGMAVLLSVILGGVLTAMRMSKYRALQWIAIGWTNFFRGVPTLVCIFAIYLSFPSLGIEISVYWALVLGELLYAGALFAEIFRAGIDAVPKGQKEAATALGISSAQIFIQVVMPQAFRWMLPLLINQVVMTLKETSLGFVIGYGELLREGRRVVEYLGAGYATPMYVMVGLTYITINVLLSVIARYVERRTRSRGTTTKVMKGHKTPAEISVPVDV
ncbi:MAG: amino acid ABC transporter permease [Propionibacteriaceae bacterium]|nr:amino acid ABC transporter permease [Propionibacteriaceae bacterium]